MGITELLIRIPYIEGRTDIDLLVGRLVAPHVTVELFRDTKKRASDSVKLESAIVAMTRVWGTPVDDKFTHMLVLEDDALVPFDAGETFVEILDAWQAQEDHVFSFFCAHGFAKKAFEEGYNYASWDRCAGGVAQCMPVAWARDFFDWQMRICPPRQPMDSRVNAYIEHLNSVLGKREQRVIFPTPCVVDHNGYLPSEAGSKSAIFAPLAIGPNDFSAPYDWSDIRVYRSSYTDRGKTATKPSWE